VTGPLGVGVTTRFTMYTVVRRNPELSRAEFSDHWRHYHGTVAMGVSGIRAYVQGHRIDTALLTDDQARYDGLAEVYYETVDDYLKVAADPLEADGGYLNLDMVKFLDMESLWIEYGVEEVLDSGLDSNDSSLGPADRAWRYDNRMTTVKLVIFVGANAPEDWARDDDLALGRRLGALRHVRTWPPISIYHGENRQASEGGLVGPPREPDIRGVHELWWPTHTEFERRASADKEALETLLGRAGDGYATLVQAERLI
jgi:EthD domain-containing protein